jgi:hypothetical protein
MGMVLLHIKEEDCVWRLAFGECGTGFGKRASRRCFWDEEESIVAHAVVFGCGELYPGFVVQ